MIKYSDIFEVKDKDWIFSFIKAHDNLARRIGQVGQSIQKLGYTY